jgi:predicted deacylase
MKNTREQRFVDVFTLFDGSKARFPLMAKRSPHDGPKVFLTGVVHGEEVVGIEVIHRIFETVKLSRGSIYAIPVCNMGGFSLGLRTVPYGEMADWGNLNRAFPGNQNGKPQEKLARAIFHEIISQEPDLVIDIHADSQNSIPYILLDRPLEKVTEEFLGKTKELAEVFGVTVCNDDTFQGYIADHSDKTLSGAIFNYARIPAFTVELGGPMVIKESFVRVGVNGVKNVLAKLGMMADGWEFWKAKSKISVEYPLRTETISAAEQSGKISYRVKPGERVEKEQLIAVIEDVFGKKQEEIKSPMDGWVISLGYQALSFPGIAIATLAVKDI